MGDEITRRTSTSFRINASGTVRMSERADDRPPLHTVDLLDDDPAQIQLGVDIREDEDGGVYLDLVAHHMKNEDSGRVFHCSMTVVLSRADIKRMQDYFGFLLASGLDGVSDD
jgi:hypothetical protein